MATASHAALPWTRQGRDHRQLYLPWPDPDGDHGGIPDEHKEIYASALLRRYGIPEEVANITLSCVIPAASFMTGVFIPPMADSP
ncbi:MAG: hypothetical protein R3C04_00090 [Hyphomonas sp.]